MRFIILHRTNAHWESGASPTPELVGRVGEMIGEWVKAGAFESGEGLRASSEGVRLHFKGGRRTVTNGPYGVGREPPAGFVILKAGSMDEAVDWASKLARLRGDEEVEVRPVTEGWDIGLEPRPERVTHRRYMALYKATDAALSGEPVIPLVAQKVRALLEEMKAAGVLLAHEDMAPAHTRATLTRGAKGPVVTDGPFSETKELVGGYSIVKAPSREQAVAWAKRYFETVGTEQVEVVELGEEA